MKIVKNNQLVVFERGQNVQKTKENKVIRSFKNKIKYAIDSVVNAMEKESVLFQNSYWIDRYSTLHFSQSIDRSNLFSPLRLLLASDNINTVYIEGYNPMQYAIKTNNIQAFSALMQSKDAGTLVNAYNEKKYMNTIGSIYSLYLKDVWEANTMSFSFTFFNAVAEHPDCKYDQRSQLEKWSEKILIFTGVFDPELTLSSFNSIEFACLMETYGNPIFEDIIPFNQYSEPGSIFFLQTILDQLLKRKGKDELVDLDIYLRLTTTFNFCIDFALSRSLSTILDFPDFITNSENELFTGLFLINCILTHGTEVGEKPWKFNDSYGTFEKLCYIKKQPDQELSTGLTALMLVAIRGWKTFAQLIDSIYLDPATTTKERRLEYFNLTDKLGRTALDYAVLYPEMQEYLKSLGCVSGTPITVSPKNATLLDGIDNYKNHEKYKKFPPLWLETFYGDVKAVESTTLTEYSISINFFGVGTELGYFGIPIQYEVGNSIENSYPQNVAILYGNVEMYKTWNTKLYDKDGLFKDPTLLNSRPEPYFNTRERNNVTIFGSEQILDTYLEFLATQVFKNYYIDFLIMSEYVLNDTKKQSIDKACQSGNLLKYNDQEYQNNWGFNICNDRNLRANFDYFLRYPSVDQTQYCGCCYAVATMTMIDLNISGILTNNGGINPYKPNDRMGAQSYQMPLSCMKTGSCETGGDIKKVLSWHQENYSVPLECVPYESWKYMKDQKEAMKPIENGGKLVELCPFSNPSECVKKAIKITSDPSETFKITTMSKMINVLQQGYAFVAVMRVPSTFFDFTGKEKAIYKRGTSPWSTDSNVYNSVTNPFVAKSSFHVVVIIGFGEENGVKYWILLNSWGDIYENWRDEKDETGNIRMVPYCRVLRGTDDLWIESSGGYYAIPWVRNHDGTSSKIQDSVLDQFL